VDTIHYAHMIRNNVSNLFSLASISKQVRLAPESRHGLHDAIIDTSKENDRIHMITCNCRDLDLHACLVVRMKLCERVCLMASLSRSSIGTLL
jgi:hypothetical protein